MRRTLAILMGVLVAVGLAWASYAFPALDSPYRGRCGSSPFGQGTGQGYSQNQVILGEFGNWIAEHPATAGSGHLGQVVYVETLSTCLLWHGHDRFLDEALEQAAQMGINARVEYRAMSLPQLIEASGWLMDNAERWAEDGFHINSIGSIGAVEGLEVVGLFTGPLAARDGGTVSVWVEMKRDQLAARIAKSVGAVVRLVEGDIVDC